MINREELSTRENNHTVGKGDRAVQWLLQRYGQGVDTSPHWIRPPSTRTQDKAEISG